MFEGLKNIKFIFFNNSTLLLKIIYISMLMSKIISKGMF